MLPEIFLLSEFALFWIEKRAKINKQKKSEQSKWVCLLKEKCINDNKKKIEKNITKNGKNTSHQLNLCFVNFFCVENSV